MKKLFFAAIIGFTLGIPVAAQFSPCVYDASPPGELQWVTVPPYFPGAQPVRYLQHVPRWEPREAWVEPAVIINPLAYVVWQFYMPISAQCRGAFDSYVNTTGANELARAIVGQYTGIPMGRPTGDVEVWIMNPMEFESWKRGQSTTTRGGSMGKSTGGLFNVSLTPGWYNFVISNQHSGFTGKVVSFQFGGKLPERKQ